MENVKEGTLLDLLKLPGALAKKLDTLYARQDVTARAQSEIEKLEQEQTEASRTAAALIDVAFNPEHPMFWAYFGVCPIKSTLRMSRNGLLLRLIYVEGLDLPNVREAMAKMGHRTTLRNIRRWHRGAVRDLRLLEKQSHLPTEWTEGAKQEGGGTE